MPFEHANPAFPSKCSLVCTRGAYFDAVGAGRAARWKPLRGRKGVPLTQTSVQMRSRGPHWGRTRSARGTPQLDRPQLAPAGQA